MRCDGWSTSLGCDLARESNSSGRLTGICHLTGAQGAQRGYGPAVFATVRHYAPLIDATADALAAHATGLHPVFASVPGWVSSTLVRTPTGAILLTVGTDEAALVECGRRVTAWLSAHVDGFGTAARPDVGAGDVLLHVPSKP